MKTGIREQKIISILESRGEMSVSALSEYLGVSVSTLRKQLADMQSRKLIIRTYGGVMSANRFPDETFDSKLHKSVSEKRRIATRARQLVHDGDGEVYSDNIAVAAVESAVLKNAKRKYVLCDSSKLGKRSIAHIVNLKECDALITGKSDSSVADKLAYSVNVDCV